MTKKTKTSDEVKNAEVTDAQEVKAPETKKETASDTEGKAETAEKKPEDIKDAENAENNPTKAPKKPTKKKKKSSTKKGMKKVKALVGNLAGKYLLSYSKGQTFEIEEKQAAEMIEAGDVQEV
ncbi:hypothetical protein [Mesonia aquimarina]|uniref:hypothetical protein n=1 Tax=Mesonia aquimarina TaxID=1504967 RepID=UPI000EF57535|nr:hypothetical protein [Mesonia aquimarina]